MERLRCDGSLFQWHIELIEQAEVVLANSRQFAVRQFSVAQFKLDGF